MHCLTQYIQFFKNGDPYEIRTRVAGVRGRSLRPLDQRAISRQQPTPFDNKSGAPSDEALSKTFR